MKFTASLLLALCALAITGLAKEAPKSPVIAVNDEQPELPRVLIIGDSVGLGYTPALGDLLKGQAALYRTRKNGASTVRGVEMIDEWIGDGKWDVIHFNFGIQDMLPGAEGKRQAEPGDYEKNLRTIVAKLKATGAHLIWASITPIPGGVGDVPGYNAIALRVMTENGVAIDDLYAAVEPHVAEYQLPQDVHYTPEGYAFLAQHAADSIAAALPAKR